MPKRKKPWYRPRNVALAILVAFGLLIGREVYFALTARPGQAVNYFDRAAALVHDHIPADAKGDPNAWPLFIDATDRLTAAETRAKADATPAGVPIDYTILYSAPDRPMYDEYHTCDQVREAARLAIAAAAAEGVPEALARLVTQRRFERPLPATGQMITFMLPELGRARALARYNAGRMFVALEQNDHAEFVAAYEQTLTLGRIFGHQFTLIDHLVAIAIHSLIFNRLYEALTERPLPEPVLRRLLEATDRQAPLPPIALAFEGERIRLHDFIQWTHTDDGRGSGRFMPTAIASIGVFAGTGAVPFPAFSEWRLFNLAGLVFPSKAATTRRGDQFYDNLIRYSRLTPQERRTDRFQPDAYVETLPKRYLVLRLMLPAAGQGIQSRDQYETQLAALRILIAIELFNAANGRYPASLDELAPSILPEIPLDPIGGQPFGYRLLKPEEDTVRRADGSPRPYLLWSVGADGVDQGGHMRAKNDPGALRPPHARGKDYVFNLPRERKSATETNQTEDAREP